MKEKFPAFITVILMPFIIAGMIKLAYAQQDEIKEDIEKINFACVPGINVETFHFKNERYNVMRFV